VIPIFAQRWIAGSPTREKLRSTLGGPLDGTLAEALVVGEQGLVHAPAHLSDEQAAALPCAGLTAWRALTIPTPVKAGDVVLVQGTGGVSIFALQLARVLGARSIVTSSSDEKLARAGELGAWQTINYASTPDWGKQARRLTDGAGVDRVIDVGGAQTLAQSLEALDFGGQISSIGNLTGASSKLDLVALFMRQARLQGILVGDRESFEEMNRAIEAWRVEPVVDRVFPFAAYREAFEWLRSGRHFGKICIRL
jgi:NADPH:quinone reductase-like Zn-dependent oxidoreductase